MLCNAKREGKKTMQKINDIKIYDELFIFWLKMKNEKDSDKRDEIIVRVARNIEKMLNKKLCK